MNLKPILDAFSSNHKEIKIRSVDIGFKGSRFRIYSDGYQKKIPVEYRGEVVHGLYTDSHTSIDVQLERFLDRWNSINIVNRLKNALEEYGPCLIREQIILVYAGQEIEMGFESFFVKIGIDTIHFKYIEHEDYDCKDIAYRINNMLKEEK